MKCIYTILYTFQNHLLSKQLIKQYIDMGVSKIKGTPKSSILIGFSTINHPFWGIPIFWKHPYINTKPIFLSSTLCFTWTTRALDGGASSTWVEISRFRGLRVAVKGTPCLPVIGLGTYSWLIQWLSFKLLGISYIWYCWWNKNPAIQ